MTRRAAARMATSQASVLAARQKVDELQVARVATSQAGVLPARQKVDGLQVEST